MGKLRYRIYKFKSTFSYTEPNYFQVEEGLSYRQAIAFVNSQEIPSDYLVQPYREEQHG